MSTTPTNFPPDSAGATQDLSSRPERSGVERPPSHRPTANPAQPLHIALKDLRHVWPEVLVSFALLIAFAWLRALAAQQPDTAGFEPYGFAAGIVRFLIPISWMVIISRIVHDEELVGDRQFWITRPYTWYFLLVAKVLFIIVLLILPLLAVQAWMLHHAGLYPTHALPAMFAALGSLCAIFFLPFLAIAAVTMTFTRYASSVLGGLIYILITAGITMWLFQDKLSAPGIGYILSAAFILLPLAAIFVQYAKRRTLIARTLLLVTPLFFIILGLLTPAGALIARSFPPGNNLGALSFDASPELQQPDGRLAVQGRKAFLQFPVQLTLTGLPPEAFLEATFLNVTIDGTNGLHYNTGWSSSSERLSARDQTQLAFRIPESVLNSAGTQPVHVKIDLAGRTWKPGTAYNVTASEKPFPLPGYANCEVDPTDGALDCHHAFHFDDFVVVSATVHNGTCLVPGPNTAQGRGLLPTGKGIFDPVVSDQVRLSVQRQRVVVCPGDPITYTPYTQATTGQLHLDIPSIQLSNYAIHLQVEKQAR